LLFPVVVESSPLPLSTPQLSPPLSSLGHNEQAEQSTFFLSPLTLGSQATLVTSSTASSTGSSVVAASGLG